ncbi:MAG: hypothetical protein OXU77_05510 [Gammaproteobacteria bacterium]|nr:hypothetical protein [Gammaproteobacteria bacterium]
MPILLISVAALAAVALFAARTPAVQSPALPPTLLVDVAVAKREPVTFAVRSQGVVAPRTRTTMVSEVSGTIVEVSPAFVAGGFFAKGDVLVRIDPRNYETAMKRATAAVAQAKTKVATENALAGYAYKDWEWLRSLEAADRPASDLTLRKPQLAEAVAGLESAEADLEKATEDLSRTVIRAPYDGMVREKRADIGQFVNTGTLLAHLRYRLRGDSAPDTANRPGPREVERRRIAADDPLGGYRQCRARLARRDCPNLGRVRSRHKGADSLGQSVILSYR